jgi:small-conductance mechanosensitive channel
MAADAIVCSKLRIDSVHHRWHFRHSKALIAGRTVLALFLLWLAALPVSAQASDQAERFLESAKAEIEQVEQTLIRVDLTDEDITGIRARVEEIKAETLVFIEELSPDLQDLRNRLEQLGEAPETGEEPETLALERADLTTRLGHLEGIVRQLEVSALTAGQISGRAANIQRTRFLQRVFEPSHSILNPALWVDGLANVSTLVELLSFLVKSWFDALSSELSLSGLFALVGAMLAAVIVVGPIRMWLLKVLGPALNDNAPSDLERIWRTVSHVALNALATLLALMILYTAAQEVSGALSDRMSEVVGAVIYAIIWFVTISSLTRGILAPKLPQWRLPPISDGLAATLTRLGRVAALVFSVHVLWSTLGAILFLPVEHTVAEGAAIALAIAMLLFAALWWCGRENAYDSTVRTPSGSAQFLWLGRARGILWLLGAVIGAALLVGYIALAAFLAEQVVITGALLVAIYLLHHLFDEVLATGLKRGWVLGDFLRNTVSLSDQGVERLGLLLNTIGDAVLLFVGLPLIVLQWAVTWIDLKSWLTTAFFGFRLGDVTISLSTILVAIGMLVAGLIITRLVVHWLDQRFLGRTRLDRGVRNSIKTTAGYAGIILAGLLAVSYVGVDFTNVAIVAGALSVGIGFGLQSIINNFVSGLILLAERPIRVGDWISVAGEDGYVTRINVRSTEIETFDRSTVIVPNSDFIAGTVKNWTSNQMGRVRVAVGVSYDADPDQVRDILLECATDHPEIRHHPEPYVVFMDFGASSLDFEIRCFIMDVENMLTVASDLRFRIFKALAAANIEIPFPQRDIHLKDIGRIEQAVSPQPPATTRSRRRTKE